MHLEFQDTARWFTERNLRQFAKANRHHNHVNTLKAFAHNAHTPKVLRACLIPFSVCRWSVAYYMLLLQGWDTQVVDTWTAHNSVGCHKTHTSICSISLKQARSQLQARLCAWEIKMRNKHDLSFKDLTVQWESDTSAVTRESRTVRSKCSKYTEQVRSQEGQAKICPRSRSLVENLMLTWRVG